MELLSILSGFFINGFILTSVLLFIGCWLFAAQRPTIRKLMVISNVYLIAGSLIYLSLSLMEIASFSQGDGEWEKYTSINGYFSSSRTVYWIPLLLKGLLPQIFWIKNVRLSIWASILLVPLLLVDFYEHLFYANQRTYLSSSWTPYFHFTDLILTTFLFGCLLIITFIFTRGKTN